MLQVSYNRLTGDVETTLEQLASNYSELILAGIHRKAG